MNSEIGGFIIFVVCFLYTLIGANHIIKNNKLRLSSYVWFPFVAATVFYCIHPEKSEPDWAGFYIPFWAVAGVIGSLIAGVLKMIAEKLKSNKNTKSIKSE